MPELPEVETVCRGLEPAMVGARIVGADIRRDGLRWLFPKDMQERLEGKQVVRLYRRAKYILGDLDSGESFIIHLGMSGRILISKGEEPLEKHDHVVLDMDSGTRIAFNDARRFGAMDVCASDDLYTHKMLKGLGPEPLGNGFYPEMLADRLAGCKMPIKSALLDQKIVAGLGNIYVCEALWRARISPIRKAMDVRRVELGILVPVIRDVLSEAIESGGSSLKDHKQTNGELGYFQHNFAVYDRADQPCRTEGCAHNIERIVQSGRSTFYCNNCQR